MKFIVNSIINVMLRPVWWVGVIISYTAMMIGILSEGFIENANIIYLNIVCMDIGVFIPLAPLAAIIPVSGILESSMKKSWKYENLIRTTRNRFIIKMAIGSALAGGVALALGWILSLLTSMIIWRVPLMGHNMLGVENTELGMLLYSQGTTILYLLFRLIQICAYGMFCVICAVPVAILCLNSTWICLVPFTILRVVQFAMYNNMLEFLSPTRVLLGKDMGCSFPIWSFLLSLTGLLAWDTLLIILSICVFRARCRIE